MSYPTVKKKSIISMFYEWTIVQEPSLFEGYLSHVAYRSEVVGSLAQILKKMYLYCLDGSKVVLDKNANLYLWLRTVRDEIADRDCPSDKK